MTEPKSIEEQIDEAAAAWSLEYGSLYKLAVKNAFRAGCSFGRELGRKETIEALRNHNTAPEHLCGDGCKIEPVADWLSERFKK